MTKEPKNFSNPFLVGIGLGLTLLLCFVILGDTLGASSALARLGAWITLKLAPAHAMSTHYGQIFGEYPLKDFYVWMFGGTLIGAYLSAYFAGRTRSFRLERGKKASKWLRTTFALVGGILVGIAARIAMGCTSGQALSGGALLLTGSHIFMMSLFAAGFLTAPLFRRQWND